jgi:hypothetical protein
MSYYEASRKVDRAGARKAEMPREKLYESPWIPAQNAPAADSPRVLSYYDAAKKVRLQKEKIYESNWILWERIRSDNSRAWVQMLKFQDRWLLLATDEAGRNYRECGSEADCYKAIEDVIPETMVMGNRSNGVIEIQPVAVPTI